MKISRLFLAILLLLILAWLVFEISNQATDSGRGESKDRDRLNVPKFNGNSDETRRSTTRSKRILKPRDRLAAHFIDLDAGESIFLRGRRFEPDISEVIHLAAEAVTLEDGTEIIRLLRTVIHSRDVASQRNSVSNLFGETDEMVVGAESREVYFRQVAQTKGTDVMVQETLLIEPEKPFKVVVVPGEEELHIDGIAEKGSNGKLRVRFGSLY